MSIKKLGKAILNDSLFGINYCVEGSKETFVIEYTEAMQQELQLIGKHPEQPRNYRYSTSAEKEVYDKKYNEYNTRRNEILKKVCDMIRQEASNKPLRLRLQKGFRAGGDLVHCVYKDNMYKFDRANYSDEEIILQIMDLEDEERRKFERLKHKFSEAKSIENERQRDGIPEEVRIAVWRRDSGKCTKCGERENLEYDHIIPISRGGSNTVRNIELLCERCNRKKKDNIQ